MLRAVAILWLAAATASAAPRWKQIFFHDDDRTRFQLTDLQFTSEQEGIAVGLLDDGGSKPQPISVLTRDGGKSWSYRKLKEAPISLFFLPGSGRGWMVTSGGVWRSDDGGLVWAKLLDHQGLGQVYFQSPERGWAVGAMKTMLDTDDGGRSWRPVAAAALPNTSQEYTVYRWVEFVTPETGIVAGQSKRRNPESLTSQAVPERPAISIMMETKDGGKSWQPETVSMFGSVTRIRMHRDGRALALIRYEDAFRWPSEVMRLDLRTGGSRPVLARKDVAFTDIVLRPGGGAYAAGHTHVGTTARSPIPGAVRVFASDDLEKWTEMPVDYRAVAHEVVVSAVDASHVWLGCSTGMILQLAAE